MGFLAKAGVAVQQLFGEIAQKAADDSGVIERTRKFTALSLAGTFVLGFLRNPKASDEKPAQTAVLCGVEVAPQAIEQRHTPKLVAFALWRTRVAGRRPSGGCAAWVGDATGSLRRSADFTGAKAFGASLDRLATAGGTGQSPSAEAVSRNAEQQAPRAEPATAGGATGRSWQPRRRWTS